MPAVTPPPRLPDLTDFRDKMPELTDVRKQKPSKEPKESKITARNTNKTKPDPKTARKSSLPGRDGSMPSNKGGSGIRDVIKDLLVKHQPTNLPKTRVLAAGKDKPNKMKELPQKKIKISNKLKISPLN